MAQTPAQQAALAKATLAKLNTQLKTTQANLAATTAANPKPVAIGDRAMDAKAATAAAPAQANSTPAPAQDTYYTKIISGGKTQAQLDAAANATQTATDINAMGVTGLSSKVNPITGMVETTTPTPTQTSLADPNANKKGYHLNPTTGKWEIDAAAVTETGRVTNADGSTTIIYSDGSHTIIPKNSGLGGNGVATDLSQGTATDIFLNGLGAMGLKDLASGVQGLVNQGIQAEGIAAWVRSQPSYATRFPAMAALNAAGQGISESAYMQKEDTDRSLLYTYLGPNATAYDNYATLGSLISGFKSSVELQSNLQAYHDAVNSSPETKAWLKSKYGLTDQDLIAYWLNPKTSADEIQLRMNASHIGGAALQTGFGDITQSQAEALAHQNVTQSQAMQGFVNLGQQTQFNQQLPGDETGSVTQQQSIDSQFGSNSASQLALRNIQAKRLAIFNEGGGLAASQNGVIGLGSANSAS